MKNGEQRMNEDNYTGFKKRLSAVEIYAYELLCPHHVFLSLVLFAVIHGRNNRGGPALPPKSKCPLSLQLPH